MMTTQTLDTPQKMVRGKSLWYDAWRRLLKNKMAVCGAIFTLCMACLAATADWICPFDPKEDLGWLEAKPIGYSHPAVKPWMTFREGYPLPPDMPWLQAPTDAYCILYEYSQSKQSEVWATMQDEQVIYLQLKGTDQKLRTIDHVAVKGRNSYFMQDQQCFHDVHLILGQPLPARMQGLQPRGVKKWRLILLKYTEEPKKAKIWVHKGKVSKIIMHTGRSQAQEEILQQEEFRLVRGETVEGLDKQGRPIKLTQLNIKRGGPVPPAFYRFKAFRPQKHFCKLRLTHHRTGQAHSHPILVEILNRRIGPQQKIRSEIWSIRIAQEMPPKYPLPAVTIRGAWVKRLTITELGPNDQEKLQTQRELRQTHYLGTDTAGRDLLSRIIYGGRISLLIGVVATIVSIMIGMLYGAISGYVGGTVDNVMMRIVDILYALPYMFLVILLLVFFGRDIIILFIALGCVQWLTMARIVRGQVLSLREKEFIEAARTCGTGTWGIILRHLIPNTLGVVVVYATLTIPAVILQEAFLSFIGLGVQYRGQSLDSWGALTNQGMQALGQRGENWWLLVFPALTLALTLLSLNFLGDGLRDALDPQQKGKF